MSGKWLWVTALPVHPPISGGMLRSFSLVNSLRHHGIDIRVHSLTGRKADYVARRPSARTLWPGGAEEYVERGLSSALKWAGGFVFGTAPVWITAQLAAEAAVPGSVFLSRQLRDSLAWCDTIVADFPFTYSIFSAPVAREKLRILSTHNVEHHMYEEGGAWRTRLMRASVRGVETRAARVADIVVCCCAADARFFETEANVQRCIVVPNAIDLHRFEGIGLERIAARRDIGVADDVLLFVFSASQWGPNVEAFDYILQFARQHSAFLVENRLHLLVVGGVAREPISFPGFTATGRVDRIEPYFAAADVGFNPMLSGIGTNVKMAEFMALRVPVLSTSIGARGYKVEDGETGFLFEGNALAKALVRVRGLFDEDPARLRVMADRAYALNEAAIDMNSAVRPLVEAAARTPRSRSPEDGDSRGGLPTS